MVTPSKNRSQFHRMDTILVWVEGSVQDLDMERT